MLLDLLRGSVVIQIKHAAAERADSVPVHAGRMASKVSSGPGSSAPWLFELVSGSEIAYRTATCGYLAVAVCSTATGDVTEMSTGPIASLKLLLSGVSI